MRALGPGLVTGAADDDPSGIGTYAQSGAQFGYVPLWLALFSYPLNVVAILGTTLSPCLFFWQASQAAEALRPVAGRFASAIFTLGIVGTGLLAVPVLAGAFHRSGRTRGIVGRSLGLVDGAPFPRMKFAP